MNKKFYSVYSALIILLLLPLLLAAGDTVFGKPTLQEKIHNYMYAHQPVDGMEFVHWANRNLEKYTNREVYEAILDEGRQQAEGGHPNAVATLSLSTGSVNPVLWPVSDRAT